MCAFSPTSRPALAALGLALVGACSQPSADPLILRGADAAPGEDAPFLAATVAITSHGYRERNWFAEGLSYCTGVVVRPNVVLTAGHCVVDDDMKEHEDTTEVVFDRAVKGTSRHVRVAHKLLHPDFTPGYITDFSDKKPANDLALLFLEANVPVAPVELANSLQVSLTDGDRLTLAGFGVKGPYRVEDTGTLRYTEAVIENFDFDKRRIFIGGLTGACKGDSGGPAFVRDAAGTWVLVGILSTGVNDDEKNCLGLNRYTDIRARDYRTWIKTATP